MTALHQAVLALCPHSKLLINREFFGLLILASGLLVLLAGTLLLISIFFRKAAHEADLGHQRMETILKGADLGYWDWNLGTDRVMYNTSFLAMLGYSPDELQPHYNTWKTLIHPDDRTRVTRHLEDHLTGRTDSYECEYRVKTRDGGWKWVLSRGHILERDKKGHPLHFAGTHLDISERIKILDDLKNALEKGKESDRLKASFLANISHEIRTPLNGIIGFCEMLLEEDVSDRERMDYGRIILKSGEQLLTLVNDILDLTRIDAGQIDVVLSDLSVNSALREIFDFFTPQFKQKGLKFTMDSALADGQDVMSTDWEKINRILTNLIDNALKFTDTGYVAVNCYRKGDNISFTVEDTGRGIPLENHDRIFERFSALKGTPVDQQGPGLGLSISKGYAESLGGSLTVHSEPGKGSLFILTLPFCS
jgi:PAS domain S-box-containing protein